MQRNFSYTTSRGFTQAQLASTASYQAKNLQGIGLWYNHLTGWDLSGQNLANANLCDSTLTNTNLRGGRNLTNAQADFVDADPGQPDRGQSHQRESVSRR